MTYQSSRLPTGATGPVDQLIQAATRLLEARNDQIVTAVEWQNLRDAVLACGGEIPAATDASTDDPTETTGCEFCRQPFNRPEDGFACPYCGKAWPGKEG